MSWRIAINGFGRIGQGVLRALYQNSELRKSFTIVAINELADADTIAYLTKYDTTHGRFSESVRCNDDTLIVGDDHIRLTHLEGIESLPWKELDVDVVFECTGVHSTREDAQKHIDAGAKKVLFSQPASADIDKTIVFGVNEHTMDINDKIVSAASCTTNAIVPILCELDQNIGIESASMTTIHSAMNDQPMIDAYHNKDLRRTRSAMANMVPVETALDKGIERIVPSFRGKLSTNAMRVPTINVSAIDLTALVARDTTPKEINTILRDACTHFKHPIVAYTEEPIASSDFIQDPHSSTVDGSQTRVTQGRLVKLLVWFDNEWGFANRMLELADYWCSLNSERLNT